MTMKNVDLVRTL